MDQGIRPFNNQFKNNSQKRTPYQSSPNFRNIPSNANYRHTQGTGTPKVTCYFCGKLGHTQKVCRLKQRSNGKNNNTPNSENNGNK